MSDIKPASKVEEGMSQAELILRRQLVKKLQAGEVSTNDENLAIIAAMEEYKDKEVVKLKEEIKKLVEANATFTKGFMEYTDIAEEFVERVDIGQVRSNHTYIRMKLALVGKTSERKK